MRHLRLPAGFVVAALSLSGGMSGCQTASAPPPAPGPVAPVGSAPQAVTGGLGEHVPTSRAPKGIEVFDISMLEQMPVPRFQARPQYPFALRKSGVSGEAVVEFLVGTDGKVYDAFAVRETHAGFGDAAVAAVSKWVFKPGRKGGRDVWTRMQVPIVFTLNVR